jgi:hypothetical protein
MAASAVPSSLAVAFDSRSGVAEPAATRLNSTRASCFSFASPEPVARLRKPPTLLAADCFNETMSV